MHRLAKGVVSVDASIIVDFHIAGRLALFEDMFNGRILISDFVEDELMEADIQLTAARTVALSSTEAWDFFGDIRRRKLGLSLGELGAITVAHSQNVVLLTNDRLARQAAEALGLPVHGGLGVLEYAAKASRLSGQDAVMILEDMIQHGAWISDELVEVFRQRVLGFRQ